MRNTIRRGILVTATAACALGFGLSSASAATVPTLPGVPELPLTSLTDLGQATAIAPTLPTLPGEQSRSLPGGDLLSTAGDVDGLTELLALSDTAPDLTGLPESGGLAPKLPTGDLGLPAVDPGALPLGLDPSQVPLLSLLRYAPTVVDAATKAPLVDVPDTDRLPVVAQVDHNNVPQKLVPNTDGVDVHGVSKPDVPDVTSAQDAVKLPSSAPQTPGMQSVGLPQRLPVVSELDLPEGPSVHDVTGDLDLPGALPQLLAV